MMKRRKSGIFPWWILFSRLPMSKFLTINSVVNTSSIKSEISSINAEQGNEIFVLDLQTKESRLLMKSDDITQKGKPMFSPGGHLLAFTSDALQRKLRQIYLYNLDYRQYYRI